MFGELWLCEVVRVELSFTAFAMSSDTEEYIETLTPKNQCVSVEDTSTKYGMLWI